MSEATQIDFGDDADGLDAVEVDLGMDELPLPRPPARLDTRRRIEQMREERRLQQRLREVYEN